MKLTQVRSRERLTLDVDSASSLIAKTQKDNGEIPWSVGDKTDPWDHVEAAMGLNIGGYIREARAAFDWMVRNQHEDGSWYASYRDGEPEDRTRDTNMTSYISVGVFHDYLINRDRVFLERMWPTVSAAIDFVLPFQTDGGELYWAKSPDGIVDPVALLTGSSSVFFEYEVRVGHCRGTGRG